MDRGPPISWPQPLLLHTHSPGHVHAQMVLVTTCDHAQCCHYCFTAVAGHPASALSARGCHEKTLLFAPLTRACHHFYLLSHSSCSRSTLHRPSPSVPTTAISCRPRAPAPHPRAMLPFPIEAADHRAPTSSHADTTSPHCGAHCRWVPPVLP
jgi:hypothetical protein